MSPVVPKIRGGFAERRGLIERVAKFRSACTDKQILLFHCASAGEFESLRPLAREFDRSRFALAVSYFSPSTRAAADHSSEFDFIDCSPLDTLPDVNAYFDALRPDCICITKHDLWPNFVWTADSRGIPCFLISGNFHPRSLKTLPFARGFHRAIYNALTEIMTVSDEDSARAAALCGDSKHIVTAGDSRYDRVLQRSLARPPLPMDLERFSEHRRILVIGSSHPDDENLMLPVVKKIAATDSNFAALIIPHDPSANAARRIRSAAVEFGLISCDLDATGFTAGANLMIVNRSGILADLYRFGAVAYVGGGFGKGVHSVLEPLAHGLPVITGPNISVSNEAHQALDEDLLKIVKGRRQAEEILRDWLEESAGFERRRSLAREFVERRAGATKTIVNRILDVLDRKTAR